MARPTNEKKDRKVDLRISQELYDELAKEGQVSAVIRGRLKNPTENTVVQNPFFSKSGKEITSMLTYFRKNEAEFLTDLYELMNDGRLTYENGKLVTKSAIDLGEFEDRFLNWCNKKHSNPSIVLQNIMERVAKEVGF